VKLVENRLHQLWFCRWLIGTVKTDFSVIGPILNLIDITHGLT